MGFLTEEAMPISTMLNSYTISARLKEARGKSWAFYTIEKDHKLVRATHVPITRSDSKPLQTALAFGVMYADEELD
jgi:hypothetical protein